MMVNEINSFLENYLGEFSPSFHGFNGSVYMILDVFWILKAILLVIATISIILGIFKIVSLFARY